MANLNETDDWAAGIYQLEEDDPVLGGPAGIDNLAPRQLASRALFQRLRNVTPWAATFAYPAEVAYVSYAGMTWKSVAASTGVEPGSDDTKWTRWAHTQQELDDLLGDTAVRYDVAQVLTDPQKIQARANIAAEKAGTAAAAVQSNGPAYGIDTGAANACVVAYTPAVTELVDGMLLWFKAKANNTGATTLNVNGLGAQPLHGMADSALQGGEIVANGICGVVWRAPAEKFVLLEGVGGGAQVPPATQGMHAMQMAQATGRLLNIQVFTVSGTYIPTPGTKAVRVRLVGGGGAGGGSPATNSGQIAFGTGGGYGNYGEGYFTAGFAGVAVTVGAGGVRALGANGGGGGASSFGALITVNGGGGGGAYGPTAAPLTAGLGNGAAPGSGGYLQVPGQVGGYGFMSSGNFGYSGRGASGIWGVGGGEQNGSGDGVAASGYGAGGSGGMSPISSTVRYGGNGAPGLVIVEEFS